MVFKSIIGATCTLLAVVSFSADAAILSYTDKGLDFTINDNDPFSPTITFSDKTLAYTALPSSASDSLTQSPKQKTTSGNVRVITPQPFPDPPIVVDTFTTVITTVNSKMDATVTSGGLVTGEIIATGRTSDLNYAGPNVWRFNAFSAISGVNPIPLSLAWSLEVQTEIRTETIEGVVIDLQTETFDGVFDWTVTPTLKGVPSIVNTSLYPEDVSLGTTGLYIESVDYQTLYFDYQKPTFDNVRYIFATTWTPDGVSVDIAARLVPIPAAVWLFGFGLIGLIGVARRKKA